MTLPPTEALSYSCLPEDLVLVARGLRRYHAKSEARRPFPHSQFGFSRSFTVGGIAPAGCFHRWEQACALQLQKKPKHLPGRRDVGEECQPPFWHDL